MNTTEFRNEPSSIIYSYCLYLLGVAFEVYGNYLDLFGFAPSNYFFCLSLILASKQIFYSLKKSFKPYSYIIVVISTIIIVIFSDFINDRSTNWFQIIKMATKFPIIFLLTTFFTIQLTVPLIINHYLFLLIPNSVLGFLQFIGIDGIWELREALDPSSFVALINKFRASGLSYFFIEYANQLIVGFLGAVYLCHLNPSMPRYALVGFLYSSILTTMTRSHIYSSILIVPAGYFLFKKKNEKKIYIWIGIILINILLFFTPLSGKLTRIINSNYSDQLLSQNRIAKTDTSMYARVYLNYVGYQVWKNFPWLGLGSEANNYLAYTKKVEVPELFGLPGREHATLDSPHNAFLSYIINYGLLGFIILIVFFSSLIRTIYLSHTRISILVVISICIYSINSIVHNGALWNTSPGIILLGLACGFRTPR